MTARKPDRGSQPQKKSESGVGPPAAAKGGRPAAKAIPKAAERPDKGQAGGGQGRVDVTGIMPEGIRVDPDITEGHPGYQESGDSEIIPTERLGGGEATEGKGSSG